MGIFKAINRFWFRRGPSSTLQLESTGSSPTGLEKMWVLQLTYRSYSNVSATSSPSSPTEVPEQRPRASALSPSRTSRDESGWSLPRCWLPRSACWIPGVDSARSGHGWPSAPWAAAEGCWCLPALKWPPPPGAASWTWAHPSRRPGRCLPPGRRLRRHPRPRTMYHGSKTSCLLWSTPDRPQWTRKTALCPAVLSRRSYGRTEGPRLNDA